MELSILRPGAKQSQFISSLSNIRSNDRLEVDRDHFTHFPYFTIGIHLAPQLGNAVEE
jgi:hypothetical protein